MGKGTLLSLGPKKLSQWCTQCCATASLLFHGTLDDNSHLFLFPLLSFRTLKQAVPHIDSQSKAFTATWRNFVCADFTPKYFWMYHVNTLVLLVLALVIAFATEPSNAVQVSGGSLHRLIISPLSVST